MSKHFGRRFLHSAVDSITGTTAKLDGEGKKKVGAVRNE